MKCIWITHELSDENPSTGNAREFKETGATIMPSMMS